MTKSRITLLACIGWCALQVLPAAFAQDAAAQVFGGEAPTSQQCEKLLAEAKLLIEVDGNVQAAEDRLNLVWLYASAGAGFAGQEKLLGDIAEARAKFYQGLGKQMQALSATREILAWRNPKIEFKAPSFQWTKANADLLKRALEVKMSMRMTEVREQLLLKADESESDSLLRIVKAAFDRGRFTTIRDIGDPAHESYGQMILEEASVFPPLNGVDPLVEYIKMNRSKAATFLLKNINAGGYLWKRRILRAMDVVRALNSPEAWSKESPVVCLQPSWYGILEVMLATEETAMPAAKMIKSIFEQDAFTPELAQAVVRGLKAYDVDFARRVLDSTIRYYQPTYDHPRKLTAAASALLIYDQATKHKDERIRSLAVRCLAQLESSDALKGMVGSSDVEIRLALAESLQPHMGTLVLREDEVREHSWDPAIGPAESQLIRRLTQDKSVAVRLAAVRALSVLDAPLDDGVYRALVSDQSEHVRLALVGIQTMSDALRGELLVTQVQDESAEVRKQADEQMNKLIIANRGELVAAALDIRQWDAEYWERQSGGRTLLLERTEGLEACVRFLSRLEAGGTRRKYLYWIMAHADKQDLPNLDRSSRKDLFVMYTEDGGGQGSTTSKRYLAKVLNAASPEGMRVGKELMDDPSRAMFTRLAAARFCALVRTAMELQPIVALCEDPIWTERRWPGGMEQAVGRLARDLPDEQAVLLLRALLANPDIADRLLVIMLDRIDPLSALGVEAGRQILQRWFAPGDPYHQQVYHAIEYLAPIDGSMTPEQLRRAVLHPKYAVVALKGVAAHAGPEDVELLIRCLDGAWIPKAAYSYMAQEISVSALASIGTDEAISALLDGLSSSHGHVRESCFEALDRLEKVRRTKQRLEELKQGAPNRTSALLELVEMLQGTNSEVRVAAVHGIASFGAVEYLPTLIRLLGDSDQQVVVAARAAIDRLNSAPLPQPDKAPKEEL